MKDPIWNFQGILEMNIIFWFDRSLTCYKGKTDRRNYTLENMIEKLKALKRPFQQSRKNGKLKGRKNSMAWLERKYGNGERNSSEIAE